MTEEVRLRKDLLKPEVKAWCEVNLHEKCFYLIQNSSARESLKAGCLACQEKYINQATKKMLKEKASSLSPKRIGLRKYLLEKTIQLERKNALLKKENEDLKAKAVQLKLEKGNKE